jgi:hypothetical protein
MNEIETIRIAKQNIDKVRITLSGLNQVKYDDKIQFIDGYNEVVEAYIGDVVVNVDKRWYVVRVNPETIKANNDVANIVDGIINQDELLPFYHFEVADYKDNIENGKAIKASLKWSQRVYMILVTPSKLQVNDYDITYQTLCIELLHAAKTMAKK